MLRHLVFTLLCAIFGLAASGQMYNPCWQRDTLHWVVLGSSTAAGTGASTPDSAWVSRYRHYAQRLNGANQVTNLAVGGFTTWRILDNGFQAPAGRPQPDTNRNITRALALQPDVIIVNLPSNDAATGTGLHQQMQNFHRLDSLAQAAGVAFYLCTTQPRNGNSSFKAVQLAVKDSILKAFGSRALDFWSGLADTTNGLRPGFDSGDGVHLNDAGHRLLFQRVRAAQIPAALTAPSAGFDLQAEHVLIPPGQSCGDSLSSVGVVYSNLGRDSASGGSLHLLRRDLDLGGTATQQISLPPLGGCQRDTQYFTLNSFAATRWELQAWASDTTALSRADSSPVIRWSTLARPQVSARDTFLCRRDSLKLSPAFSAGDSLVWFQNREDSLPWRRGPHLAARPLPRSDTFYLEARRPPFYYQDVLRLSQRTEVAWNGIMFDLIAGADTVFIDSLSLVAGSNGAARAVLLSCNGTHRQNLSNAAAWQHWGQDTLPQAVDGQTYWLRPGRLSIPPFDTVGVYLYMDPAQQRLRYGRGGSSLLSLKQGGLEIRSGTGISHTYGTSYFSRLFPGQLAYHYGNLPAGQCQSARRSLVVTLSQALILPDTLYHVAGSPFTYQAPAFARYRWSTGDTGRTLQLGAGQLQAPDSLWISLRVTDARGCRSKDSLLLIVKPGMGLASEQPPRWQVLPQPAGKFLEVRFSSPVSGRLGLYFPDGRLLRSFQLRHAEQHRWNHLPKGLYLLRWQTPQGAPRSRKVVVH